MLADSGGDSANKRERERRADATNLGPESAFVMTDVGYTWAFKLTWLSWLPTRTGLWDTVPWIEVCKKREGATMIGLHGLPSLPVTARPGNHHLPLPWMDVKVMYCNTRRSTQTEHLFAVSDHGRVSTARHLSGHGQAGCGHAPCGWLAVLCHGLVEHWGMLATVLVPAWQLRHLVHDIMSPSIIVVDGVALATAVS
jgi:hypothetical protein